jgi:hypothetical protein
LSSIHKYVYKDWEKVLTPIVETMEEINNSSLDPIVFNTAIKSIMIKIINFNFSIAIEDLNCDKLIEDYENRVKEAMERSMKKKKKSPKKTPKKSPKQIFCEIDGCGGVFKSVKTLNVHQKVHLKPITCGFPGCVYVTHDVYHLKRHLNTHK